MRAYTHSILDTVFIPNDQHVPVFAHLNTKGRKKEEAFTEHLQKRQHLMLHLTLTLIDYS